MAQAQINVVKSDKLNTPTYNPKFSPPQSQDAFGLEMGMYDHRPIGGNMDREDFGILTTSIDGIITAMNVMSDQMNNHTTLVVNELKEHREKNAKFMEKVDKKLLEMKKDMQKLLKDENKENDEDEYGRNKQTQLIIKDERERFAIIDKQFLKIGDRMDKWERSDDSFRHNLYTQVKEDNQKLLGTMEGILKNLQEEREEKEEQEPAVAAQEPKKKGACFICNDPGHWAPDCPNKPEKKPQQSTFKGPNNYNGPNAYKSFQPYQRSFQPYQSNKNGASNFKHYQIKPRQGGSITIEEKKKNSNCYHCGQQGHWASDCPIKDIPAYDENFWSDVDNLIQNDTAPAQAVQQAPPQQQDNMEFMEFQAPAGPAAPKKRKLSLKKKNQ